MKLKALPLAFVCMLFSGSMFGQSVSLTPNTMSPSTFTIGAPLGAGSRSDDIINTSQNLKYRGSNSFVTFVQANISSGTIPPGITFYLSAGSPGSTGKGIPDPEFVLGYSPHNLMTSIAIQAPNIQVPLTFRLVISDFSQLRAQNYPLTITYTILQQWW